VLFWQSPLNGGAFEIENCFQLDYTRCGDQDAEVFSQLPGQTYSKFGNIVDA